MAVKRVCILFCLYFLASLHVFIAAQGSWLNFEQEGDAGFYPEKRELTTAGELFRDDLLEVAHARVAYGSVVEIVNLQNKKTVRARINDRIYKKKYIIGLNKATADALGIAEGTQMPIKFKVIQIDVNREGIAAEKEAYMNDLRKKIDDEINRMADSIIAAEKAEEDALRKKTEAQNAAFEKLRKTPGIYDKNGKSHKITGYGVQIGNFHSVESAMKRTEEFESKKMPQKVYIQTFKVQNKLRYKVFVDVKKVKKDCYPLLNKLIIAGFTDAFVTKY